MPNRTKAEFNRDLCARVKALRIAMDCTQEQMATALGTSVANYRKYESRTPIPHHLIPRLALMTGRDVEWILTGKKPRKRPALPPNNTAK